MAAYMIVGIVSIADQDTYADYQRRAIPTLAAHGGKIVAGAASERVEGDWQPATNIIVEFPSMSALRGWYGSAEYSALRALRQGAAAVDITFVEGS